MNRCYICGDHFFSFFLLISNKAIMNICHICEETFSVIGFSKGTKKVLLVWF